MKNNNLKIAVLSGKGGAGKTLLSVNLSAVAKTVVYMDCDVEEPNGHLFFNPDNIDSKNVTIKVPVIDEKSCNNCRTCVDFCKFNALAFIYKKVYIFEDVCHSCGGCSLVCPTHAISEKEKIIGKIQIGKSEDVTVISGMLNPGVESGIPIIKEVLKLGTDQKLTIIDCPPGSSCSVMESIKDADYCVLVAEPTIFGAHNLNMIHDLVKLYNKPFGVVLNKCMDEKNPSEVYCNENGIRIIGKIPFDSTLGSLNSKAIISSRVNKEYANIFYSILQRIFMEVNHETVTNS